VNRQSRIAALVLWVLTSTALFAAPPTKESRVQQPIFYRTLQVDGLSIFYREAGPKEAPTLLLLHGLPSSSRMFDPLLRRLSDWYFGAGTSRLLMRPSPKPIGRMFRARECTFPTEGTSLWTRRPMRPPG
jgi:hypothetical protein